MDENLQQPPIPPILEEPTKNNILPVVLTSTLMILIIAAVGYFYFQKKQPLAPVKTQNLTNSSSGEFANWKTYKNEKYGLEFQYPPQLSVTSEVENSGMMRVVIGNSIIVDAAKLYNKTWEQFLKELKPYSKFEVISTSTQFFTKNFSDSGTNDDIKWLSYVGGNSEFFYNFSIIVENKYDIDKPDYQNVLNEAKKSVETFRSIQVQNSTTQSPQTQLQITKDWNTYKSTQFAFEISYPKDWSSREGSQGVRVRNYTDILKQPKMPINIDITYYQNDNPKELSVDGYISEKFVNIKSLFDKAKTKQKITIGGQPAIKFILEGDYSGSGYAPSINTKTYEYYISRGKDIINIKYVLPIDTDDYSVVTTISTLKFVTFNQKTYDSLLQEETNKVIGADTDKDGVWDYIQQWIDKNYSGNIRISLRLMAQEVQFDLINYRDKEAISKHAHETFGHDCLHKAEPDYDKYSKISNEFRVQMVNTEDRIKAYFMADAQKGGVYSLPDENDPVVVKYCGF